MSKSKKPKLRWADSPEGLAAYTRARAQAQAIANESGGDVGIECNEMFKQWRTFLLPQRRHRQGHELQCEVVMCENIDRCLPGHGPTC